MYNVEPFLAPCLESLLHRAFDRALEVILVNDCSTDQSQAVCERYVHNHPDLFKLISHPDRRGVSVARNTGLRAASGEFFTFVDGDDLVPPNAFQDLYNAALAHDADVVKGNNTIFNDTRSWNAPYNTAAERICRGHDILSVFFDHKIVRGHTWGKLFRRSCFAGIQWAPGVTIAQDVLYCAEIFHHARTLALIDKTVYHYRLRNGGTTNRKFESQAFLWWLYSIETCGRFAKTAHHAIRHKRLETRTLLQITREARHLPVDTLRPVLHEIAARRQSWNLTGLGPVLAQTRSVHSLFQYFVFQRTLRQLQRKLRPTDSNGVNH